MLCLHPIRTCFSLSCPCLDENDGFFDSLFEQYRIDGSNDVMRKPPIQGDVQDLWRYCLARQCMKEQVILILGSVILVACLARQWMANEPNEPAHQ